MKRWIAFLIALSLATAQGVPPVFRLHVIADSNSEADQAIKLAVRDAIIQELGDMDGAQTSQEAEQYAAQHLEELIETANGVLEEEGFPYRATAEIGTFEFPDKTYGDVIFPAGEYRALRTRVNRRRCGTKLVVCAVSATVFIGARANRRKLAAF